MVGVDDPLRADNPNTFDESAHKIHVALRRRAGFRCYFFVGALIGNNASPKLRLFIFPCGRRGDWKLLPVWDTAQRGIDRWVADDWQRKRNLFAQIFRARGLEQLLQGLVRPIDAATFGSTSSAPDSDGNCLCRIDDCLSNLVFIRSI